MSLSSLFLVSEYNVKKPLSQDSMHPSILTDPISKEEIETAIKTLKSKTVANMGIAPNTLKEVTKATTSGLGLTRGYF